jgi:hypothetical protein
MRQIENTLDDSSNGSLSANDIVSLKKNESGVLVVSFSNGEEIAGVTPVRAFPITDPEDGYSLVDAHGHEVVWVEQVSSLPADIAFVFKEELQRRDFMPVIRRIAGVSSYITPCDWHVETDRGVTKFTLKGEEDIRRLGSGGLLITDIHGIHYLLKDVGALEKADRKILDRFL